MKPDASSIVIRTHATGMLARFAHDLQIAATFEGALLVDGQPAEADGVADETPWRCELTFPAHKLLVEGVVKHGALDTGVLSATDVADIEKKLRSEVLPTSVKVVAHGTGRESAELEVTANRTQRLRARLHATRRGDHDGLEGTVKLSLKALGITDIKGPLGAFKVDDSVEVRAFIALA